MSIKWLLESFQQFSKVSGKSLIIVPVMISYDRKFESGNIAAEMVSGEKVDYNIFTSLKRVHGVEEDQLGQVYVKYLDPINIETWLRETCTSK